MATLFIGSYQSLREAFVEKLHRQRMGDLSSKAVVLIPSNELANDLREVLLCQSDCADWTNGWVNLHFLTLIDLAKQLLSHDPPSLVTDSERFILTDQLLEQDLDEASYLEPIAESRGLPRVLSQAFRELKEGMLFPEEVAQTSVLAKMLAADREGKNRSLFALFSAYQNQLQEADRLDREDLLRRAGEEAVRSPFFAETKAFALFGFYDLNPLQTFFLDQVFGVLSADIFLPWTDHPVWEPFKETRRFFEAKTRDTITLALPNKNGRDRLARSLFSSEGSASLQSEEASAELEILSVSNDVQEIQAIARKMIALHEGRGVAFDRMVLVHPRPEIVQPLIRQACADAGIPLRRRPQGSLIATLAGSLAVSFLELREREYPRDRLMNLLRHPLFSVGGDGPAVVNLWDQMSREAGISRGKEEWLDRLELLVQREERASEHLKSEMSERDEKWESERHERRVTQSRRLQAFVDELLTLLDEAPEKGEITAYTGWLRTIFRRYGKLESVPLLRQPENIQRFLSAEPPTARVRMEFPREVPDDQLEQWERYLLGIELDRKLVHGLIALGECLDELERAATLRRRPMRYQAFAELFRELAAARQVPQPREPSGVRVLTPLEARGLETDVLFFAGVNEGLVPNLPPPNPLFDDRDRRALNTEISRAVSTSEEEGKWPRQPRVSIKGEALHDERVLFLLALTAPRQKIVLSFSRVELSGRARFPSPFLQEVWRAYHGAKAYQNDFHEQNYTETMPHSAIGPREETPSSPRALRLSIVAPFLERDADPEMARCLLALCHHDQHLLRTLEAEEARAHRHLRRYDAVFPDPERLSEHAGEDLQALLSLDHPMSVTGVDDFGKCPFLFYARHILRLQPVEEPERVREVGPLEIGRLYHTMLRRFFTILRDEGLIPIVSENKRERSQLMLRVVSEELDKFEKARPTGAPLLWQRQRQTIVKAMKRIIDIELALGGEGERPHPYAMEVAFGRQPLGESDAEFSTKEPLSLSIHMEDGQNVDLSIRGKLDRVDRVPSAKPHLIVRDYKSGRPKPVSKQAEYTLFALPPQVVLYYLAARDLLFKEPIDRFAYYYVGEHAGASVSSKGQIQAKDIEKHLTGFEKLLARSALMVQTGVFFPNVFQDHNNGCCPRCEYASVCRKRPALKAMIRRSPYRFFSGEGNG